MSAWGTDVLAVACIMGGAAVSGGATLAALRSDPQPAACEQQLIAMPRVVVGIGGTGHARDVVVRPRMVRVHSGHGCAAVVIDEGVRVRIDQARIRAEVARVRAEQARERIDAARSRVDAARARADAMRARADAMREQLEQARIRVVPADEIQARLEEELARVQEELARLDAGGGGR